MNYLTFDREGNLAQGGTVPSGVIRVRGRWTTGDADRLRESVQLLVHELQTPSGGPPAGGKLVVACDAISEIDGVGAYFLCQVQDMLEKAGIQPEFMNLSTEGQLLLERSRSVRLHVDRSRTAPPRTLAFLPLIAMQARALAEDLQGFITLLGDFIRVLGNSFSKTRRMHLISLIFHIDIMGVRAIPITGLMSLIVGAIITQQAILYLRLFGAELFVVDMLGILTVRELAIVVPAILVAGRSGSAITAEIGAMRMREEFDAMRVMNVDPVARLLAPRILALVIALPLLYVLSAAFTLLGGAVIAVSYGELSFAIVLERLRDVSTWEHISIGLFKAPIMGAIIGLIACLEGMRVEGRADSLGWRTTSSVVKTLFIVVVADGLFAIMVAQVDFV